MKNIMNWVLAATRPLVLIMGFCCASVMTSCTSDTSDNPVPPTSESQPQTTLQVGSYVWGSTIYAMGADGAARLAEVYEKAGIQRTYCI